MYSLHRNSVSSCNTTSASPSDTVTNWSSLRWAGNRWDIEEGEYGSRAYEISLSGVGIVIGGTDFWKEGTHMEEVGVASSSNDSSELVEEEIHMDAVGVESSPSPPVLSRDCNSLWSRLSATESPAGKIKNCEVDIDSKLRSSESREESEESESFPELEVDFILSASELDRFISTTEIDAIVVAMALNWKAHNTLVR